MTRDSSDHFLVHETTSHSTSRWGGYGRAGMPHHVSSSHPGGGLVRSPDSPQWNKAWSLTGPYHHLFPPAVGSCVSSYRPYAYPFQPSSDT
eukprot:1968337-Prymnesium_polylepis.1